MNRFKDEIITAHIAIENWLGRGEGELDALMAHFSQAFTMVTLTGVCLDFPALNAFFLAQKGSHPGLQIAVDSIELLETWPGGAALRYRETQCLPDGQENVRWSTALLNQTQNTIQWRHLHETAQA
jgi:Uncharacterized protein conserved in bacteria